MNVRNKRKIFIYVLLLIVAITSIAYASLASVLDIIGTANLDTKGTWNIYFDNLRDPIIKGRARSTSTNLQQTTFGFGVVLNELYDSVTYIFDVVNDGILDARLSSVSLLGEDIAAANGISYTLTYEDDTPLVPGEDILEAKTSRRLKVIVKYDSVDNLHTDDLALNLEASLIYVQYENNNVDDPTIATKAYLANMWKETGTDNYFKTFEHKDNIKYVYFVNHIDTSKAVATYDLSSSQDGRIIGWINDIGENNYELYIGSNQRIYAKQLTAYFAGLSGVERIYFNNLDTSELTSMSYTFSGCSNLTSLDLSGFDTSKVTNMGGLFNNCKSLTSLDLSNFNTSNVTTMGLMFSGCENLTSLDISSFNTSKVTTMLNMFTNVKSLKSLDLSHFNTSSLTSIAWMFESMESLTYLDLSNFDTSKIKTLAGLFINCKSLTHLDLSSFDTTNVTEMGIMFTGMSSLRFLDLRSFSFDNVTPVPDNSPFAGVPADVYIIVKDDDSKQWIYDSYYNGFGDIVTVSELPQ